MDKIAYVISPSVLVSKLLETPLRRKGFQVITFKKMREMMACLRLAFGLHQEVPEVIFIDLDSWRQRTIAERKRISAELTLGTLLREKKIPLIGVCEALPSNPGLSMNGYVVKPLQPHKIAHAIDTMISERPPVPQAPVHPERKNFRRIVLRTLNSTRGSSPR